MTMKLLSVRVENIKGCELAEVRANEGLTVIGGENGQGKSSFLDGLCMALGGKTLFPPEPLRDGEDEAEISVRLSGGTDLLPWPCEVRRSIERRDDGVSYTTKVEIVAEGEKDPSPSPQTLLDSVVSNLSFDPLGFIHQSPKEQVNTLKELVGIDFSEIDRGRQELYDERTRINRLEKQLDGKIKQTPIHDNVPPEPISVRDLMERLHAAEEVNREAAEHKQKVDEASKLIGQLTNELAELHDRVAKLESQLVSRKKYLEDLIEDDPPVAELEPIRKAIVDSEEVNRKVAENKARLKLLEERNTAKRSSHELTKRIDHLDVEKRRMAENATWPIAGLGFGPEGVVYKGKPFVQLSSSEQMEVSVAIALSINKEFPFAIVRNGSLLDDQSMNELSEIVAKHKGQCLVERVSKGPECHVIFEEGRRAR